MFGDHTLQEKKLEEKEEVEEEEEQRSSENIWLKSDSEYQFNLLRS